MSSIAEALGIEAETEASVEELLDRAARRFDVTVEELLYGSRRKGLVAARQVAYWLLRARGLSYPEIGRALGGKDHTTVMSGVRKVQREREDNPQVAAALDELLHPPRVRVCAEQEPELESGVRVA